MEARQRSSVAAWRAAHNFQGEHEVHGDYVLDASNTGTSTRDCQVLEKQHVKVCEDVQAEHRVY